MSFAPKHILVPVAIEPDEDFLLAEHAVLAACDIAEKYFAKITLLNLAPVVPAGGSAGMDISGKIYHSFMKIIEARHARSRLKLKELQEAVENRGIAVEGRVVDSLESIAHVICDTAEELGADLLVIGSHGRSGLSRVFFGSIAEKVSKKATIPILLLHPMKEKKA
jgi:nucleotide-binding universal stress UspA family protein